MEGFMFRSISRELKKKLIQYLKNFYSDDCLRQTHIIQPYTLANLRVI